MATDKPGWKPLFPPHLAAEIRGPLEALLRDATARRDGGNKTMPTKVSDRRQRFWGVTGDAPPADGKPGLARPLCANNAAAIRATKSNIKWLITLATPGTHAQRPPSRSLSRLLTHSAALRALNRSGYAGASGTFSPRRGFGSMMGTCPGTLAGMMPFGNSAPLNAELPSWRSAGLGIPNGILCWNYRKALSRLTNYFSQPPPRSETTAQTPRACPPETACPSGTRPSRRSPRRR